MSSISLNFIKNDDLKANSSKYLGCPSIPKSWIEKDIFDEKDIFLCQINLEELMEYNIPLQKSGILYFFINTETQKGKVFFEKDENLVKVDFNDYSLIGNNYEYAIKFSVNNECYLDGTKLFGTPIENAEFDDKEDILLLQIDTLQEDNIFLANEDAIFQYVIKKKDLATKDFSKIKLYKIML